MEQEKQLTSLPENAYRELKPGEEYTPIMPASSSPREVTPYSVTMGIVMAIVFSAAAAFLGLKVGQVFEAAIPIAIIAVGMGNVMGKRNMLGQNVIIQSIGASSGVIVAGAIFTLPALYILGLDAAFYQVFLSSLFGGLLGIVLLIPFRKYFVKEMHGKYPFPEATATTEVLISGEKGGNQAKLLAVAGLIGGLYDFAVGTFGMWTESVSTRICAWGQVAADKFKVVFSLNTSAAVLGLGYIIGLKYAMIITAGSCLVWFLVVPLVGSLADTIDPAAMASLLGVTRADILADPASIFTAENLFAFIGKPLGIGGIAISLGFQDTLSNLIGGLQVSLLRIIKPGDNIEVGSSSGVVKDITWRHTTIRNGAGEEVLIPNSIISKTALTHLPPTNQVSLAIVVTTEGQHLDEVAEAIERKAGEAAAGIGKVVKQPKLTFSEITAQGYAGSISFSMADSRTTGRAIDAVLRAVAPLTRTAAPDRAEQVLEEAQQEAEEAAAQEAAGHAPTKPKPKPKPTPKQKQRPSFRKRMARALRLRVSERELVRAALLHDYFLYDWHEPGHVGHATQHPVFALRNAREDFDLSPLEENVIASHMWPLPPTRVPRSREAVLVCVADKWCSLAETLLMR